MPLRSRLLLASSLALVLLAGCPSGGPATGTFPCRDDRDCAEAYACVAGPEGDLCALRPNTSDGGVPLDGGGAGLDAAGPVDDASAAEDAGDDGGTSRDAGTAEDAGHGDAGIDGPEDDGGPTDGGAPDGGPPDGGAPDAGPLDGGPPLTPLLDEPFEGGLPGAFTAIYTYGSKGSVSLVEGHTGSGARCVPAGDSPPYQAAPYLTLSPLRDEVFLRARVKLEAMPGDDDVALLTVANNVGAWVNIVSVDVLADGRLATHVHNVQAEAVSSATMSLNVWHELQLSVVTSSTEGAVALSLDGVPLVALEANTGDLLANQVLVGLAWTDSAQSTALVIDDVVIDDVAHALPLALP